MGLATILRQHSHDLALLIGNGINRHANAATLNSWDDLLVDVARDCMPGLRRVPPGTGLTEFYDVVELKSRVSTGDLQAEFCRSMADWLPFAHHRRIMRWAVGNRVPVLTTNFDDVLSQAVRCEFQFPRDPKFTAFYPWDATSPDTCSMIPVRISESGTSMGWLATGPASGSGSATTWDPYNALAAGSTVVAKRIFSSPRTGVVG